jgi:DNA-binding MarR family transcriptional regulator
VPKDKPGDAIDVFIAEWRQQRPELDFDYLATVGRILRISAHLRDNMDGWLAPFGLSWEMFDLLASLRRDGGRDGLRPTHLYRVCMLSSGATTNRIDRAQVLGFVERRPDPLDGRATRIALTKRGRALVNKAMSEHAARGTEIAAVLSLQDRQALQKLLGSVLHALEKGREHALQHRSAPAGPPPPSSRPRASPRTLIRSGRC